MTLEQLETFKQQLQREYQMVSQSPPEPGREAAALCAGIEVLAGIRTLDALITQEKIRLAAPPGPTGPAC